MSTPPQHTIHDEEQIVQSISNYPNGIGIDDLYHIHRPADLNRRTLQRRLSQLVAQKRLTTTGEARALKYHIASSDLDPIIPLSQEGHEILAHVRRPKQERETVGYVIDFLRNYKPNESFYLPEIVRTHLVTIGKPPMDDHPAGTFARDIMNRLLIDLSWASSRLEGNTYTRLDTERLIAFGEVAEGKDAIETQMVLNHKAAIEFLVEEAELISFNAYTIFNLHALLSDGLLPDPQACGRIRFRAVEIGGSVYSPLAMPQQVEELFRLILSTAEAIQNPFEQSFFVMVHLPYLQPFEDVNKRVSRLAANIPLIKHNLCPLSFIGVPTRTYVSGLLGVYELNRIELLRDVFVWIYEQSAKQYLSVRQQLVPPNPFRLQYRSELSATIQAVIRGSHPIDQATVAILAPKTIAQKDRQKFTELVIREFETLYEGNIIRFGLRPSEFSAWQEARRLPNK